MRMKNEWTQTQLVSLSNTAPFSHLFLSHTLMVFTLHFLLGCAVSSPSCMSYSSTSRTFTL